MPQLSSGKDLQKDVHYIRHSSSIHVISSCCILCHFHAIFISSDSCIGLIQSTSFWPKLSETMPAAQATAGTSLSWMMRVSIPQMIWNKAAITKKVVMPKRGLSTSRPVTCEGHRRSSPERETAPVAPRGQAPPDSPKTFLRIAFKTFETFKTLKTCKRLLLQRLSCRVVDAASRKTSVARFAASKMGSAGAPVG